MVAKPGFVKLHLSKAEVTKDIEDEARMTPAGTVQRIKTSLLLGVQLDEEDVQLFLRDYYRDLQSRHKKESFPEFSVEIVLDELLQQFEEGCGDGRAGRRSKALCAYSLRAHGLHLAVTGSDYGSLEQRSSPYSPDRVFYHLGRELIGAEVDMDFPGYNPYRSTRKISPEFVASNLDGVLEVLPDFLWWAAHDKKSVLRSLLAEAEMEELRRSIELAGIKTDSFGLYLSTQEKLLLVDEVEEETL